MNLSVLMWSLDNKMRLVKVFSYFLPLVLAVLLIIMFVSVSGNKKKIVIDNDAGSDDAIAIFLTLLHEKKLVGPDLVALTTANGNTHEDNVYVNNQRILRIAQRDKDIPIYRGSKKSILYTPETTNYFGLDGMGDQPDNFTDLVPAKELHAVNALIELSKQYEGDLTVVCIGPFTNIALAMILDPGFLNRLEHLYLGAGHIQSAEFPEPEFNAKMDVEAYHIVATNSTPDKVTLLPYSQVQLHLNISMDWRKNVFGVIDTDIIRAINRYEQKALSGEASWYNLDPALVAFALNPELVTEYKYYNNNINLCGNERGLNTNVEVEKSQANVRTIYAMDQDKYKQYLLNVFL